MMLSHLATEGVTLNLKFVGKISNVWLISTNVGRGYHIQAVCRIDKCNDQVKSGPGTNTGNSATDYGTAVYILLLQSNQHNQVSSVLRNYYLNCHTCTNAWHFLSSTAKRFPSSASGSFERQHCLRVRGSRSMKKPWRWRRHIPSKRREPPRDAASHPFITPLW